MGKAKTIFQHLSGIKEKKVEWNSLSDMDKKTFSPFIINRWLSMNFYPPEMFIKYI